MTCEHMKLIKAFKRGSREEIAQSLQVMEKVQKIRREIEKIAKSGNVCG